MDRGYEDKQTRLTARELGYTPVVPPRSNRRHPWEYDRELYKRRNEVERFFRRLKAFRCVGTRYEKLDVMFSAFILIAIISISLHCVHTS
jgi:transposase